MANVHERTTKLKSIEDKIPQSLSIFLKITLHDNLGNEFSQSLEEINVLRYKSSRKEMLDLHFVGNFTVGVCIVLYY
jgi:nuclear pore complex protein Nup210